MGGRPCKIPSKLAIGNSRELGAGPNTTVPARGLHGCLPIAWPPYRPSKVDVVCLARTTCAGERRLLRRIQNSVACRRTRVATWNAAREIARELVLLLLFPFRVSIIGSTYGPDTVQIGVSKSGLRELSKFSETQYNFRIIFFPYDLPISTLCDPYVDRKRRNKWERIKTV